MSQHPPSATPPDAALKHEVFLSYSRADTAIMERVKADLEAQGLRVWIDMTNIPPGTPNWRRAIQDAIVTGGCLLVILSPSANESRWVNEEIDYAEFQEKPIFTLLGRGEPRESVPFGLARHQWIDIREDAQYAAGIAALIAAITQRIDFAPNPPAVTPARDRPPQRPARSHGEGETLASPRLESAASPPPFVKKAPPAEVPSPMGPPPRTTPAFYETAEHDVVPVAPPVPPEERSKPADFGKYANRGVVYSPLGDWEALNKALKDPDWLISMKEWSDRVRLFNVGTLNIVFWTPILFVFLALALGLLPARRELLGIPHFVWFIVAVVCALATDLFNDNAPSRDYQLVSAITGFIAGGILSIPLAADLAPLTTIFVTLGLSLVISLWEAHYAVDYGYPQQVERKEGKETKIVTILSYSQKESSANTANSFLILGALTVIPSVLSWVIVAGWFGSDTAVLQRLGVGAGAVLGVPLAAIIAYFALYILLFLLLVVGPGAVGGGIVGLIVAGIAGGMVYMLDYLAPLSIPYMTGVNFSVVIGVLVALIVGFNISLNVGDVSYNYDDTLKSIALIIASIGTIGGIAAILYYRRSTLNDGFYGLVVIGVGAVAYVVVLLLAVVVATMTDTDPVLRERKPSQNLGAIQLFPYLGYAILIGVMIVHFIF